MVERLFDEAEEGTELRGELLRNRQRQTSEDRNDKHQSVGEAVRSKHVEVLRYLLEMNWHRATSLTPRHRR